VINYTDSLFYFTAAVIVIFFLKHLFLGFQFSQVALGIVVQSS